MSTTIKTTLMRTGLGGMIIVRPFNGDSRINILGEEVPVTITFDSDKAHEPVFTETQVKAMLMELVDKSEFSAKARWEIKLMHVNNLAAKHGIQLP